MFGCLELLEDLFFFLFFFSFLEIRVLGKTGWRVGNINNHFTESRMPRRLRGEKEKRKKTIMNGRNQGKHGDLRKCP